MDWSRYARAYGWQLPLEQGSAHMSRKQRREEKRRVHEAQKKAKSIDKANDKRKKREDKKANKNRQKTDKKAKKGKRK